MRAITRPLRNLRSGAALGDVEDFNGNGFIDDNFNAADPLSTLTNSWALLVDPLDPSASAGLTQFSAGDVEILDLQTPGIDILMESWGLGIGPGNPVTNLVPLMADDYGMRQFLYPELVADVPEPSTLALLALGILFLFGSARLRYRRAVLLANDSSAERQ